jgi:hypothetical protein
VATRITLALAVTSKALVDNADAVKTTEAAETVGEERDSEPVAVKTTEAKPSPRKTKIAV